MLDKVRNKARKTGCDANIRYLKSDGTDLTIDNTLDFILMFYVAHEIPEFSAIAGKLAAGLKSGGRLLLIEPPVHVSRLGFRKTVEMVQKAGLTAVPSPHLLLDRVQLFEKA